MSESIDGAALIVATHIVLHENQKSGEDLIVSTAQTAVKLIKAYREATAAATAVADYSPPLELVRQGNQQRPHQRSHFGHRLRS